jgi:hypothetical protein
LTQLSLWSTDRNNNIPREMLPFWLKNADLANIKHTHMRSHICNVIDVYVDNIIEDDIAEIFCLSVAV